MTERMIPVNCPECGATFSIEANRKHVFCTFCGSGLLIRSENDCILLRGPEMEAKQAEMDRKIWMMELELAEKRLEDSKKIRRTKIGTALFLGLLGIVMVVGAAYGLDIFDNKFFHMCYALIITGTFVILAAFIVAATLAGNNSNSNGSNNEKQNKNSSIRVPSTITGFKQKDYSVIGEMFVAAGFTNVRCIALNDLKVGVAKKPDTVESISINGTNITGGGGLFPKDAAVIISYHSMNRPPRTEEKQFGE